MGEVTNGPADLRTYYWKQRYEAKREAGICVMSSCLTPAVAGQTRCESHRARNNRRLKRAARAKRKKKSMQPTRERLPEERVGVTLKFTILASGAMDKTGVSQVIEVEGYCQTGEYDDGRIGEVFVKLGKAGANEALFDQWAMAVSMALQYGAGVEELFGKHVTTRFQPAGKVLNSKGEVVDTCTSVLDYVSRWIIKRYANRTRKI